jgi:signal transduction histidine kinase/DNA-binding response OmpR family regulator
VKRVGAAVAMPLRLVSWPVALVVAALLLLGAWCLVVLGQVGAADRDARGALLLSANALAGAVDAPFVPFAERIQGIRSDDFVPRARVAATGRMLRLQSMLPGNGVSFMVDASGRLLSASAPFMAADSSVASADWFRDAMAGGSNALAMQPLTRPWLGLTDGVVLWRQVRDDKGATVGLVGAVLPSSTLQRLVARGWLPPGTRVAWRDSAGRSILDWPAQARSPGASGWLGPLMVGLARELGGAPEWSVAAPLQHLDATIVATAEANDALRARPLLDESVLALGAYLLAVWLICLVVARALGGVSRAMAVAPGGPGFGSDWQCELDGDGAVTAVHGFAPLGLRAKGEKLAVALGVAGDSAEARAIEEALVGRCRLDGVVVPLTHDEMPARFHRLSIEPEESGGFRCSGRDVTQQCRAEATAAAAGQARSVAEATAAAVAAEQEQVLASLGHDIRTPMTTIMGICGLLLEGELEHEHRGWLERLQASGQALLGMLNGLLALTANEVDRATTAPEPMDVAALVLEVTQVLAPQARDKGLDLRVRCDDQLRGEWMVDPVRLRQVLFNLISNAVKFTASGSVEVRAAPVAEVPCRLRISVSDTGPGIDAADRELIFERFKRGRDPVSAARPGVGLGLALARESAALMGGTLTLDSALGIGSEFTLTVPVERAPSAEHEAPFAGRTALIVAEEDAATRAATVQLGELGLVVETAPDGFLGLALAERLDAQRGAVDLVVLQGNLVSMPAEVFLLRLRATAFGRRASVVWVGSAAADVDVDASVPSPADPYQVVAAARQLLGARASLEALEPDAVVAGGGRVLLVEDDRTTQAVVAAALSRRGFAVFVASDGEAATRLAAKDSFDAILMDLHMPGVDGFTAVRQIRTLAGRAGTLPVIALTAFHGSRMRQRCMEAGFSAVLEKPINIDRLEATLRRRTFGAVPAAPAPRQADRDPMDHDTDVSVAFVEEMVAVIGLERARACIAEFIVNADARCRSLEDLLPGWEGQAIIRQCEELANLADTCGAIGLQEIMEELADAVSRDDQTTAAALIGRMREAAVRLPTAIAACLDDVARRWDGKRNVA